MVSTDIGMGSHVAGGVLMGIDIEIKGTPILNVSDDMISVIYNILFKNIEEIINGDEGKPAFIAMTDDDLIIGEFAPRNQVHKEMLKHEIHQLCTEKNASHIAFIVDTWMSKTNDFTKKIIPREDPNRMEAILVFLNDYNGNGCTLAAFYERTESGIIFEKVARWSDDSHYFLPMIGPWGMVVKQ